MAKLFSLTQIIMPNGDVIARRTVFDGTPLQAKQFDKLKVARPATAEEIQAAVIPQEAVVDPDQPSPPLESVKPPSGAPGDPQSVPKGSKG